VLARDPVPELSRTEEQSDVTSPRPTPVRAAASLLLCSVPAAAGEEPEARAPGWTWEATPAHLEVARALRESRRASAGTSARLVARIAAAGPGALEAQLDVLARRRVPETGPDDAPQVLSDPQRELLLAAIARMPSAAVRAAVAARLEAAPDDADTRLAAIHVLGAVGAAKDLARLPALAPRKHVEERVRPLTREAREAVRAACAAILGRDARALEVLQGAVHAHPPLAPQAVALAVKCGRSTDPALDREFAAWMTGELRGARPEYARSLLQAIGVLDDGANVPALIERLEDADGGVRESAVWALRRVSGLGFAEDPQPWRVWYADEAAWHERARPRLREDLGSHDVERVVAALRAYSDRRTRRAELAEEVAVVLGCAQPELRRLACSVLQQLGVPSACGALAGLLEDAEDTVSEAAWQALRALSGLDLPRDAERVRDLLRIS
jgi:HEAT repeat protein